MIELLGVTKTYDTPAGAVVAIDAVTLEVRRGELLALTGRSGSGKSTLLNLIAGADLTTAGSVHPGHASCPRPVGVSQSPVPDRLRQPFR